jgi:hypothetical protein
MSTVMRAHLQSAALVGLGVAVGAFVAVPASHLIGHEDDHIHVGGQIIYVDPDDPDAVSSARKPEDGSNAPDAPSPETPEHGQGSLAHFGTALTSSAAPLSVRPPSTRPRTATPTPETREGADAPRLHDQPARAPPAR